MKRVINFLRYRFRILFFLDGFLFGIFISIIASHFIIKSIKRENESMMTYIQDMGYIFQDNKDIEDLLSVKNNINLQKGVRFETFILKKNEDLVSMLLNSNFSLFESKAVVNLMREVIDFRTLQYGQKFDIEYSFESIYQEIPHNLNTLLPSIYSLTENRYIKVIKFKDSKNNRIEISKRNKSREFTLIITEPIFTTKTRVVAGSVTTNLFVDVLGLNVKAQTLYQVLNEFGSIIDFQRDIKKDDKFKFVLDTTFDQDNEVQKERILFAGLVLNGKRYQIFNFNGDFYDENGNSVRKALLKSPIDGARISSNFSYSRKHPVLGYSRAHLGIDFAAPTGTPIYSAGSGTVLHIGWKGGLGKTVTVKHNQEFTTNYGHMSRFNNNIKVGSKVNQRQVIGYVGSTGIATGPHLHYEVLRHGVHINPKSIKTSAVKKLDKNKLDAYAEYKDYISKILANNA